MALQNDLTSGSVRSQILRFAFPLIFSNLFQALYNAVDMIFVGQYTGPAGLSAVSVSGPIMNIMIMTVSGLSVGVTVVIANHWGSGHAERVKRSANTAIALYLIAAALVTAAGVLLTPQILRLVQTPEAAFSQAVSYLRTIFAGVVFLFGYNLIGAFQRGFGDSRSSMMFVMVAAGVNVLLDYVFIAHLHWAAFGAAFATVLSQALSFVMGVCYFRIKKHIITFTPLEIRIHRDGQLLRLGLPSAGQQLLLQVSLTTLSGIANSFGLAASAGYGVGVKIDSFALLPSDAINLSVSSFTSQNIGAGKPERATQGLREALRLDLLVAAAVCALVFFFGGPISSIFNSDPEVVGMAAAYLRISCFSYFAYALCHPMIGFLRGTGNALYTLCMVVFSQYLIRIPTAFLCTKWWGFPGIAVALMLGPIFSSFMYAQFILRGRWKRSSTVRAQTGRS